uniref:Uncharacterized protein n=1 Tax=Myotis myotis TaxID=51298 RepID=A0A7J7VZ34_MYOMY|nr:hypothetical protein mMyoMyo1_012382 [Myotis myotis]
MSPWPGHHGPACCDDLESSVSKWRRQGHRVPSQGVTLGGGRRRKLFLLSMVKVPSPGQPWAWQPRSGSHGQGSHSQAATARAAMGGAATGKVSRLASAWVTRDLGEVREQFSEVWSLVGLIVAEVRLPGRSQGGAGGAAPLTQALKRDLTWAQGSSCPRGCRPRCSLLPAPGPRGACCPALLCTCFLEASASVPGTGATHPGQARLSGDTSPGASGRGFQM